MTNNHEQVADPDGFNKGTYGLDVCNESFATSNKVVRTKLMYGRSLREVPMTREVKIISLRPDLHAINAAA